MVHAIDVADDMSVLDLGAYIAVESGIEIANQVIVYHNQPLDTPSKSLIDYGIKDQDFLVVVQKDMLERAQAQVRAQQSRSGLGQQQQPSPSQAANVDPDSEEGQRLILEGIRRQAVEENFESALEHNPEVFGSVTMLYVDVEVNGHKIKAFVDSGAQMTVMNPSCVEKCHLAHLVDTRYQGVAQGVGTSKILGRVHSAPIKVGDGYFPCSFVVIDGDKSVDLLLGLDMLRRHQGCIDLRRNCLVFGDSHVEFLSESEIPKSIFTEASTSAANSANLSSAVDSHVSGIKSAASQDTQTSNAGNTATSDKYPSDVIENLMGLGFSRQEVLQALDAANGNAEVAAAMLFG